LSTTEIKGWLSSVPARGFQKFWTKSHSTFHIIQCTHGCKGEKVFHHPHLTRRTVQWKGTIFFSFT
jgi:hypothetical protein